MIQRLKDLGYADADFPVNNTAIERILNQPRELTERSKCIRPDLDLIQSDVAYASSLEDCSSEAESPH